MAVIRVEDIAHVRFRAPDLGVMARFLGDFGLVTEQGTDGVLYARGSGPAPFLHATEKGEAGFAGLGLRAQSLSDLERLAKLADAPIETLTAPGGGSCVRLTDPSGHRIEVVAGQQPAASLPSPAEPPHNCATAHARKRAPIRLAAGPAHVLRLGHAVLEVADFRQSEAWYKEHFGFITSDEIELAPGQAVGAFLRCDLGDTPTDHHTLFLLQSPGGKGFNHAAFEVAHYDDLMCGHDHLKRSGYMPAWGIGRHILGSQIFDYWKDPWGHEMEHWTDGDLFTAADGSNKATLQDLLSAQWGPQHPLMAGSNA